MRELSVTTNSLAHTSIYTRSFRALYEASYLSYTIAFSLSLSVCLSAKPVNHAHRLPFRSMTDMPKTVPRHSFNNLTTTLIR